MGCVSGTVYEAPINGTASFWARNRLGEYSSFKQSVAVETAHHSGASISDFLSWRHLVRKKYNISPSVSAKHIFLQDSSVSLPKGGVYRSQIGGPVPVGTNMVEILNSTSRHPNEFLIIYTRSSLVPISCCILLLLVKKARYVSLDS